MGATSVTGIGLGSAEPISNPRKPLPLVTGPDVDTLGPRILAAGGLILDGSGNGDLLLPWYGTPYQIVDGSPEVSETLIGVVANEVMTTSGIPISTSAGIVNQNGDLFTKVAFKGAANTVIYYIAFRFGILNTTGQSEPTN